MMLTDGSMSVDKEAESCPAGQMSELHAQPQHLSDRLFEERSVFASLWARAQVLH